MEEEIAKIAITDYTEMGTPDEFFYLRGIFLSLAVTLQKFTI